MESSADNQGDQSHQMDPTGDGSAVCTDKTSVIANQNHVVSADVSDVEHVSRIIDESVNIGDENTISSPRCRRRFISPAEDDDRATTAVFLALNENVDSGEQTMVACDVKQTRGRCQTPGNPEIDKPSCPTSLRLRSSRKSTPVAADNGDLSTNNDAVGFCTSISVAVNMAVPQDSAVSWGTDHQANTVDGLSSSNSINTEQLLQLHGKNQNKKTTKKLKACKENSTVVAVKSECSNEIDSASEATAIEVRKKKLLVASPNGLEDFTHKTYLIGDLLWSRIPGHPWWPSMVSYDPFTSTFMKWITSSTGERRIPSQIHVQFFGATRERGWVRLKSTMVYEGRSSFEAALPQNRSWQVKSNRLPAWEYAAEEADQALTLTRQERIQKLTFVYKDSLTSATPLPAVEHNTPKCKVQRKRKHNSSAVPIESVILESADRISSPMKKKQKLEAVESSVDISCSTDIINVDLNVVGNVDSNSNQLQVDSPFKKLKSDHVQAGSPLREGLRSSSPSKKIVVDSPYVSDSGNIMTVSTSDGKAEIHVVKGESGEIGSSASKRVRAKQSTLRTDLQRNSGSDDLKTEAPEVVDKQQSIYKQSKLTKFFQSNTSVEAIDSEAKRSLRARTKDSQSETVDATCPTRMGIDVDCCNVDVVGLSTLHSNSGNGVSSCETSKLFSVMGTVPLDASGNHQATGTKRHRGRPSRNQLQTISGAELEKSVKRKSVSGVKVAELTESSKGKKIKKRPQSLPLHDTGKFDCSNEGSEWDTNYGKRKSRAKHSEILYSLNNAATASSDENDAESTSVGSEFSESKNIMLDVDNKKQTKSKGRAAPTMPECFEIEHLMQSSSSLRGATLTALLSEEICSICEELSDTKLVHCNGSCLRAFHHTCIGLASMPAQESFTCDECTTGQHTCFVCGKIGTDTECCAATPACGRFYHRACALQFPSTRILKNRLYCPLHTCAACFVNADDDEDDLRREATRGRFYRCIRCPTAYHTNDLCIAAGSIPVGGLNIICSRHFQPNSKKRCHERVNVGWCFGCSKGGTLICCDSCPAAFHVECIDTSPAPADGATWFCKNCLSGRQLHYGDIVWVKLGMYRWWPCEICHPCNVPDNIFDIPHDVGEFPVRFFGTNEYYWIFKGRCFYFQDDDKGGQGGSSKLLARAFKKAVEEAQAAYKIWSSIQIKREEALVEKCNRKPAHYKHVKNNVPIEGLEMPVKVAIDDLPSCQCRPGGQSPCGPDSDCINRYMFYECHPSVCPNGEQCMNQRFQRRQYPAAKIIRTDKRGWGLVAAEDIAKGDFVCEYVGDLIDERECKRRLENARARNITNFYMLTLDKNRVIDAGPKGNLSRFMNHSCQPNCETQKWNVNGDVRIGLFAIDNIASGTELTFDYRLDCCGNEKTVCHCGTPVCSGFIGVRRKGFKAAVELEQKVNKRRKKRRRVTMAVIEISSQQQQQPSGNEPQQQPQSLSHASDAIAKPVTNSQQRRRSLPAPSALQRANLPAGDNKDEQATLACRRGSTGRYALKKTPCFACHQPFINGSHDYVMCGYQRICGKPYHLHCAQLASKPEGKWCCPRHKCAVCGNNASAMCSDCTKSYCKEHLCDNIIMCSAKYLTSKYLRMLSQLRMKCVDHGKDLLSIGKGVLITNSQITQDCCQKSNSFSENKNCSSGGETKAEVNVNKLLPGTNDISLKVEEGVDQNIMSDSVVTDVTANGCITKLRSTRRRSHLASLNDDLSVERHLIADIRTEDVIKLSKASIPDSRQTAVDLCPLPAVAT